MKTVFASLLFAIIAVFSVAAAISASSPPLLQHMKHNKNNNNQIKQQQQPGMQNVTTRWETQLLDHFGWRNDTWQQRWFVNDEYFDPSSGNVFLYTGNEANGEVFVNWTGAMWTRAQEFKALLVFTEHRFYGESLPCPGGIDQCGDYFSMDQAVQDYISLSYNIMNKYYPGARKFISFGGSYGGILSAAMRIKAPQLFIGAIASSAPYGCNNKTYRGSSYWQVVTNTAESSVPGCAASVYKAMSTAVDMINQGGAAAQQVARAFHLCENQVPSVEDFSVFIKSWWDSSAMGFYPFATDYISGDSAHYAPPLPAKHMCNKLVPQAASAGGLLQQLFEGISVLANLTQDVQCYNVSKVGKSVMGNRWSFLVCTNFLMNELPFFGTEGPPNDMFVPSPTYSRADYVNWCSKHYNKVPRFDHMRHHGLSTEAMPQYSNMVLFEGAKDPWSSGGVGRSSEGYFFNVSDTMITYVCPDCGHHMDLMPPNVNDTASVLWIRRRQTEWMWKWINEFDAKHKN